MKITELHWSTLDSNEETILIDDEATEAKRITYIGKDFYGKPIELSCKVLPRDKGYDKDAGCG